MVWPRSSIRYPEAFRQTYNAANGRVMNGGRKLQLLINGRIFTGEEILPKREVLLDDGVIQDVRLASRAPDEAGDIEIVDLEGGLLAPGFIDCQVNGGGGVMFNDQPSPAGIDAIIEAHRGHGTTGLLPTLISDDYSKMRDAVEAVRIACRYKAPGLLGLHLEGPYLNPEKNGAHKTAQIRPLDDGFLELITGTGLAAVVVTLAPEMVPPGTIRALSDDGVRVCAGHCAPGDDQIAAALDEGLAGFTHLFNAMPPMLSRDPGVVGAALADRNTWCGIIADGHHVEATTLRVALAAKSAISGGKMMLVTDAMAVVGAEQESFALSGQTVTVAGGRCTLPDGTLAGSCLDMATAVRNTVSMLGQSLEEALRMASLYPAGFLGLNDHRGRIAESYCADLVLLDDDLNVQRTWIGGQMAVH